MVADRHFFAACFATCAAQARATDSAYVYKEMVWMPGPILTYALQSCWQARDSASADHLQASFWTGHCDMRCQSKHISISCVNGESC